MFSVADASVRKVVTVERIAMLDQPENERGTNVLYSINTVGNTKLQRLLRKPGALHEFASADAVIDVNVLFCQSPGLLSGVGA